MRSFYLVTVLVYISTEILALPFADPERIEASRVKIRHISRRKRSIDSDQAQTIDLEMDAFDTTHRLQLRSPKSLFTESFQYHNLDVDSNGNVVRTERTPSKREIQAIEQNIYVDHEANAVLRFHDVDGVLEVDGGLVGNMRISRGTDGHTATDQGDSRDENENEEKGPDYLDTKRPIATPRGVPSGKASATPEVCFVVDYDNGKIFNFDEAKIMDYVAIMLNAANNRYATLNDPQVVFKLSGIYVIKSQSAQPFLEKSKNSNGKIQIKDLLERYSKWVVNTMKNLQNHDLFPLLYGIEPTDNTVGLAWVKGACGLKKDTTLATSVSFDAGGTWKAAYTLAHEFAHNLGSPHDGEGDSKSCTWEQGYIMSYKGYGTLNKFTFSSCTASLMKEFIQSTGGRCLTTANNPSPPPPIKGEIGERITMQEMCKKRYGNDQATVRSDDPNVQCLELVCKVVIETPTADGGTRISTNWKSFGELPGDDSPCGKGGKCKNGKCVGG